MPAGISETITLLQRLQEDEPEIARRFERWRENRPLLIMEIEGVQGKVENYFYYGNGGRTVGKWAAMGGILSGVWGAILYMNGDLESASSWFDRAKLAGGIAGVAIGVSTVLESFTCTEKMSQIQTMMERDKEETRFLRPWVEFSHTVNLKFDELLQCKVTSPNFAAVISACRSCMRLLSNGSYEINDLVRDLVDCRVRDIENISRDVYRKLQRFFTNVKSNPEILASCNDICRLITIPNIFRFVKAGAMTYCHIKGIVPLETFNFGGLDSNGAVLDTINLLYNLLTTMEISKIKERQSRYLEALRNVRFALQLELNEVVEQMDRPG